MALDGAAARRHRRPRRRHPVAARGLGGVGPPRHLHRPAGRLPQLQASGFRLDQLDDPEVCPNCGAKDSFTEARQFNLMFKTHVGPVEDAGADGLPAARDGAGHLRQLQERAETTPQEAAVRHRPDRQVVPQRDHAGQLHLPHPRVRADGDGVLRAARRGPQVVRVLVRGAACAGTSTSASPRTSCACGPTTPTSCRHYSAGTVRRRVPVPVGLGRARGHRQPHRLRPHASTPSTPARSSTTSTRPPSERYVPHVIEPAAGADPHDDGVPPGGLRRGGGAGRDSAPCCASTPASRPTRWRCCRCRRRTS